MVTDLPDELSGRDGGSLAAMEGMGAVLRSGFSSSIASFFLASELRRMQSAWTARDCLSPKG